MAGILKIINNKNEADYNKEFQVDADKGDSQNDIHPIAEEFENDSAGSDEILN